MPPWLLRELRSDHAGETGAVEIYRGILASSACAEVRAFAARHLETEVRHLALMDSVLPQCRRSRLLPLWKVSGWSLGAVPALLGPKAVFATIDAVETFVDGHYGGQIEALAGSAQWRELREMLERCRADEVQHRDEARAASHEQAGALRRAWSWLIATGSAMAVAVARRI